MAPLDWGLGHAARCIPVIRKLTDAGFEVIIGTSGKSGVFLKAYFPQLQYTDFPFLNIRYSTGNIFCRLFLQLPGFLLMILREHHYLKKHAGKLNLDLVISDNRYGLHHKDIYSVIISHQLFIRLPAYMGLLQKILWHITGKMLARFDECWIPDLADQERSLGHALSHGKITLKNYRYVGLLSRFTDTGKFTCPQNHLKHDLLVILSGPEPQRTILENAVVDQALDLTLKIMIFRGLPSADKKYRVKRNITLADHPDDKDFIRYVKETDKIICRSGYSTVMDLIALQKRALLVPTPGQTEQIYLARHLAEKGLFIHMPQKHFNIKDAFMMLEREKISEPPVFNIDDPILKETVEELMNTINRQQRQ